MTINKLAKIVHENAVAHGWWDDEREAPEIIALIHSEWSEALEEARAGRPMVWYSCGHKPIDKICDFYAENECDLRETEDCPRLRGKPEGAAVELIDGCIRILDYMGRLNGELTDDGKASLFEWLYSENNTKKVPEKLPELVAYLHLYTASSMNSRCFHELFVPDMLALCGAMAAALSWVKKQGLDPLSVLLDKHEYNKGRPYRHGKQF